MIETSLDSATKNWELDILTDILSYLLNKAPESSHE